jgi:N-acetylglucosamine malate deacetylase 1
MKIDVLAFGPHPDDAEIGAGGTLLRTAEAGAKTAVVTLTRGEMGSRGSVAERAAEFDAAAAAMGLAHHAMLDLPDGRLASDERSREAVVRVLRDLRPSVVLAPYWEDRHPDHPAASRIVQDAVFLAGLARYDTGQSPHRPGEIVYYMAAWEFEPSFVVDISAQFERKLAVLRCYGSQLHNPDRRSEEPATFISSGTYRDLLAARAAHFGRRIGAAFAEPFRIRGLVEVPDLVAAFGGRTY